jgi:hypothetical protein
LYDNIFQADSYKLFDKILTYNNNFQQMLYSMKRNLLLTCFGLFLISGLFGQEIKFKCTVDSAIINKNISYSIAIEITGDSPYNIYLYDKYPWNGGIELKREENFYTPFYKFSNLPKGNYFIVLKNDEYSASKSLKIK